MIGAINCGVFVKSFNNYQFGKIQFDCETKADFSTLRSRHSHIPPRLISCNAVPAINCTFLRGDPGSSGSVWNSPHFIVFVLNTSQQRRSQNDQSDLPSLKWLYQWRLTPRRCKHNIFLPQAERRW